MKKSKNKYAYVFVRETLPDTVKLVQASHASMEMGFVTKQPKKQTFLVVLSVKNEAKLLKVASNLKKKKIKFKLFYEPDYEYGYTALCTEPVIHGKHKFFKKFNLVTI